MSCQCDECCEARDHYVTEDEANAEAHRRWETARALATVAWCAVCGCFFVTGVQRG